MTSFALKIIACITMLIDHFTYLFIPYSSTVEIGGKLISALFFLRSSAVAACSSDPGRLPFFSFKHGNDLVGRGIGRIAFPVFCFLLVEGFYRTASRRKYMLRMLIFALVSEIPFDLAFTDFSGTASCMSYQNVMFTLLFGLALMYLYEELKARYLMQPLVFNTLGVILIVGVSAAAVLLRTDYNYLGILGSSDVSAKNSSRSENIQRTKVIPSAIHCFLPRNR